MSDKPAMLALEDELAAYFARSGFMAVEVDDLPEGSAIPWLPPIDLEELDPARAAKGSGQIAVVPDSLDARVAAIAIPRLTTAEIEALRLHVVPSAADLDIDLEFDLIASDPAEILADDARAVLTEAWGVQPPPPVPRSARSVTIPPVELDARGPVLVSDVEAPAGSRVTIPPLVFPHATLDLRAATRIIVAQRLARVDLAGDGSIPWLAPVAISDAASQDELAVSVIIYDAQLEVPV